ncbi:hypothetical protein L0F63_002716, partial [Massospora cicadina]
ATNEACYAPFLFLCTNASYCFTGETAIQNALVTTIHASEARLLTTSYTKIRLYLNFHALMLEEFWTIVMVALCIVPILNEYNDIDILFLGFNRGAIFTLLLGKFSWNVIISPDMQSSHTASFTYSVLPAVHMMPSFSPDADFLADELNSVDSLL